MFLQQLEDMWQIGMIDLSVKIVADCCVYVFIRQLKFVIGFLLHPVSSEDVLERPSAFSLPDPQHVLRSFFNLQIKPVACLAWHPRKWRIVIVEHQPAEAQLLGERLVIGHHLSYRLLI